MQTAREHPRQSGAIGPSDPPAESFIPQTGGPGNASFSFVSLATAASFGFGLKTILLDRDRGNDAGVSRSVPRADRTRVANHQEDAPKTAATQKEDNQRCPLWSSAAPRIRRPSRTRGPPLRRQERGQQSIVPSDFALIPKVLNEFDACEHTGTDKLGNKKSLVDIVTQLAARPHEEEWFEFKTNWCEPRILGEYVSALSNAVLSRPNPHRS